LKLPGNVSWNESDGQDTPDATKGPDAPDTVILISKGIYPAGAAPFDGYIKLSGGRIVEMAPGTPGKKAIENTASELIDEDRREQPVAPGPRIIDVGDNIIIPGLIDLHIHGSFGFDVASPDSEAIPSLARYLAGTGTTSFLPTLGAMPIGLTDQIVKRVSRLAAKKGGNHVSEAHRKPPGAHILGLHLEGPFLNPEKKGAMREEYLLEPSVGLMARWFDLGEGTINRVTIAPELPGAREVVSFLVDRGVTVAAGHTMAGYEQALDALAWGVTVANHTYNAMREFCHRDPGMLGAVLTDNRIWAEILCDGIHVHPAAALIVLAAKGRGRVCLVSDALAPAGLLPGSYTSLGHDITVDEEGRAYLANGVLAGSTGTLLEGVKNMMRWTGGALEDILPMATINPAVLAGVSGSKGSLAPGKDADLVVLDNEHNVVFSLVNGTVIEGTHLEHGTT